MITMTPRQRAICALEGGIPDRIPTFELEFQLSKDLLGKEWLFEQDLQGLSDAEIDRKLHENAEYILQVYEKLEHDIIPVPYLREEFVFRSVKYMKEMVGDKYLFTAHGDGTYSIPDGNHMYDFAYRIADDMEGVLQDAENMANGAIERNKRYLDHGVQSFILCADYCYNSGPFVSPAMFAEIITPYLAKIIEEIRKGGGYAIKHTDGNIMPILDQLIEAKPHAIHSLDPMAGVDIAEVKRITKGKCAIVGNVNCALLQTGTEEEIIESAMYAINSAKEGGGYIYSTSNVPFRGLPLDRYLLVLDVWKQHRDY
ncbi:MAG: hypothetical protein J6I45_11600 [Clostridia bacterium]|nr:hypothetical protein [Clostridia bacterium]